MKRKIISTIVIFFMSFSLISCTKTEELTGDESNTNIENVGSVNYKDYNDEELGEINTYIKLGDVIEINGSGAKASDNIIEITAGGTYSIEGTLEEGQIRVNVGDNEKVYIELNSVNISNSQSSAIYIINSKKTIISVKDGTTSTLSDGTSYEYVDKENEEPSATIFSKDDLTFIGNGNLVVNGNFNNGITSKDDLRIQSGNITVKAINTGVRGKDSVTMKDGVLNITSEGDGIKANNDTDTTKGFIWIEKGNITINAGEDGIQAETELLINNGDFNITTGGGSVNSSWKTNGMWGDWGRPGFNEEPADEEETEASAKGIKAGSKITIDKGTFSIDSSDDSIHSNGEVIINNGTFNISSGDDGIHADSILTINEGIINIIKSYEGIESETININGGKITIVSTDDGINAAGGNDGSSVDGRPGQNNFGNATSGTGTINISGGYILVDAVGDGIDANGSVYITGGEVYVNGPIDNGNGSLDYDNTFEISNGILVAVGSSGMAQTPSSSSKQNIINLGLSSQKAGTNVKIIDSKGNEIINFTPSKQYSSVIVSTSSLKKGDSYDIYIGESKYTTIIISDVITSYGSTNGGGMGMPSGGKGNRK